MRSVLFVFLIGCGGGNKPPQPQPPITEKTPPEVGSQVAPMIAQPSADVQPTCAGANIPCAIDTLAYFSKQMCGCKDKGCADQVNSRMAKWGEEMSKNAQSKPTAAEQQRATEVVTKYSDCMTKLMLEGQTPPMPDPCGGGGGDPCGD